MKPTINIVGAGNLGKTLAKLVALHKTGVIQGICNTSIENSKKAILFIEQGQAFGTIEALPSADITFITTPDAYIESCCKKLTGSPLFQEGSLIVHCSGSHSSDLLNSAKQKKCLIASVHPMRSFARPEISVSQYKGTYCAIEGDKKAIPQLYEIFEPIGSIVYLVNKNKKSSYHAAGVFASNYLVTICNSALRCLKDAGVEETIALKTVLKLFAI